MRVLLDANVLIAAVATRGLCEEVVQLCLMKHHLILSNEILDDIEEKLITRIKVPRQVVFEYLQFLRRHTQMIDPEQLPEQVCRDPDDLRVLGLVGPGHIELVVTGDKDLLVLKKFKGAQIMSPRYFWELHTKRIV